MKTLKFKDYLVPKILDGSKTTTWRLFDDKDLSVGDELLFVNKDNMQEFAKAKITDVKEKTLGELTDEDFDDGHEKYPDRETMLAHYKQYYGDKVTFDSIIKMLAFELVEGLSLHINS